MHISKKAGRLKKILAAGLASALVVAGAPMAPVEAKTNTLFISSVSDWNQFANNVTNGNSYEGYTVILTQDLDFWGEDVRMAGTEANGISNHPFKGVFDGRGHSFQNITMTKYPDFPHEFALFACVANTVRNVYIENIKNYSSISALAMDTANGGEIENCHVVSGIINADQHGHGGAIVANVADNTTIRNCSNGADITGSCVGGMSGFELTATGILIENCYNTGTITGGNAYKPGGITGCSSSGLKMINCYNAGTVSSGRKNTDSFSLAPGGIALNCFTKKGVANQVMGGKLQTDIVPELDESYMKSEAFVNDLNEKVRKNDRKWVYKAGSYPELDDTIELIDQKITGVRSAYSVKRSNKKQTIRLSASANTALKYKVTSGSKYISVKKNGVVTIKKKAKVGTYKIKITAEETEYFKKATMTVKIKVKK